MKYPILLLLFVLLSSTSMAQALQEIRLQGVARDNGQILTNTAIDVRVTISATGAPVYQETHALTTDGFGQFGLNVGNGTPVFGTFQIIPWETEVIHYDLELDTGSGYSFVGGDLFRSVPYAISALTASDMSISALNDVDTTGIQVGQVMKWDGSNWVAVPDSVADDDDDPTNELQQLSLTGNVLSISSPAGNSVTLPTSGGSYTAGPGIDITGNVISNTGDTDATNEIQSIALLGNQLLLSNGGGTVLLPQYTAGAGISITGNVITNTGDSNPTDDLTIGTPAQGDLSGTYPSPTVSGLQGNPVSGFTPSAGQVLTFNGGQWEPQNSPTSLFTETADTAIYQGGAIQIQTPTGDTRAEMGINLNGNGYYHIYDNTNTLRAGIRINGAVAEVFGDAKNFRMDHPEDPEKEIWYTSLEGPEAAAYVRGTATLENGIAEVPFPEHFQLVANPESMTVMLTPLSGASKGLAVVEKTDAGFRVVELLGGEGNYRFDWEVKCVRNGFEGFEVIREK